MWPNLPAHLKEAVLDKLDDGRDIFRMAKVCREDRTIVKSYWKRRVHPVGRTFASIYEVIRRANHDLLKMQISTVLRKFYGPSNRKYPRALGILSSIKFRTITRAREKLQKLNIKFQRIKDVDVECEVVITQHRVSERWTLNMNDTVVQLRYDNGNWIARLGVSSSVMKIDTAANRCILRELLSLFKQLYPCQELANYVVISPHLPHTYIRQTLAPFA